MTISQGFSKNSSDFVSWVVCSPQHDWTLALQTRTLEPTFDELNLSHRSRAAPRTGRTLVATWGTPILPSSTSSTSSPCRWTGDYHVKMMIWMILILIIMTTKKWTRSGQTPGFSSTTSPRRRLRWPSSKTPLSSSASIGFLSLSSSASIGFYHYQHQRYHHHRPQ